MPTIRVRACVALVDGGRLLLVPHYDTDAGPVQWHLPGGAVAFGEPLRDAARREVREETGLDVDAGAVIGVSEVVAPERTWHSITVAFAGAARDGTLAAEPSHPRGTKPPRWFTRTDLATVPYHPQPIIDTLLDRLVG